ncbi:MAG: sulfite exporter TauE/SafE family protein [Clostridia bacterium]|nr:sulfite exporter TauE/SafE family protein [Clostridia bacterium]
MGAGGGFLLVPWLLLEEHLDSAVAAGTSLLVVLANAASGASSYARQRRIDYGTGLLFASATVPGAVLGARVAPLVADRPFRLAFALLLACMAAWLVLGRNGRVATPDPRPAGRRAASQRAGRRPARQGVFGLRRQLVDAYGERYEWTADVALGVALSLAVGFLSSFLGIGGGVIHVPLLVLLLGYPAHVATATSHFILVFTALAGVVSHGLQGTVDLRLAWPLALGAVLGAPVGAWLARRARPRWVMTGLGFALLVVALRLALAPT